MASTILLKRSNTAGNDAYTGALGEVTIDTQARKLRIHDGVQAGGYVVANMSDVQAVVDTVAGLTIADIAGLQDALDALSTDKADKTTAISAGNGLTGGGDLSANRTVTLGTPSTLTGSTTNSVTADSHTHAITVTKADVGLSNVDNTSDLNKPISSATQTALNLKVDNSALGVANGVATLDSGGKVPTTQLPSFVDDVLEFASLASFPATGETGKIYVAIDTNKTYRWSGTAYIYITSGAVDSVAGKTGVVTLVKADVGLSNVDNTSDLNKPISSATQTALNLKANLSSPSLTGTPTAPTAPVGTNSTQIATTEFVQSQIGAISSGVTSVSGTAPITVGGTSANPVIDINNATTTTDGAMSAADKLKLDGIEAGAEVNTVTSVAGKTGDVTLVKADVSLGSVQNYGIATEAENIAGTTDIKYTTPGGIRDFVEGGTYTIDGGTF
jgi:hypothetical protein